MWLLLELDDHQRPCPVGSQPVDRREWVPAPQAPYVQEEDPMRGRVSGISVVLGLAAFVLYGLFTQDWQIAMVIGLGLAGFGGAGLAGLGRARAGRGGATIPGGTNGTPSQQPKGSGRRNEL